MIAFLELVALKIFLWLIILPICWAVYLIRHDRVTRGEREKARLILRKLHEFKTFREML